ncbi:hypothetical protein FLP41_15155 [Paracoccus marcusii]|uniref:hypothetical protein n=1 Tax=Paracoccus marcusii TaxID=59779 RepID=UPI002ED07B8E|nr:hypothetical protein FLP41_15155 [Paracoccus marcusii]
MSTKAQTRSNQITPTSFDEKAGTIKVVYSTGARVDRGVYLEDLVVSEEAIDATRLDAGAVHLIRDHMPYGDPVGRVISTASKTAKLCGHPAFERVSERKHRQGHQDRRRPLRVGRLRPTPDRGR